MMIRIYVVRAPTFAHRLRRSGFGARTIDPANAQNLARIAEAGEADVDAAVKAAREAYDTVWSKRNNTASRIMA
ncbi:MAG: aldehyde dehydrogenase family protein [Flavobacteriales bacterium]|nr:MAG: aldehyde dehydrogenase family protein [Flavobacteriales bacterium]